MTSKQDNHKHETQGMRRSMPPLQQKNVGIKQTPLWDGARDEGLPQNSPNDSESAITCKEDSGRGRNINEEVCSQHVDDNSTHAEEVQIVSMKPKTRKGSMISWHIFDLKSQSVMTRK